MMEEESTVIRLTNEHAALYASGVTWSPDDQQLVGACLVTPDPEIMKAILGSLQSNGTATVLTLRCPAEGNIYLRSARRGFTKAGVKLAKVNASGLCVAMLHPLAGDPRLARDDDKFFYVVAIAGNGSTGSPHGAAFVERLQLAVSWGIAPEWASYLLEAGQASELVAPLPILGEGFLSAYRVARDDEAWGDLIAAGLAAEGDRLPGLRGHGRDRSPGAHGAQAESGPAALWRRSQRRADRRRGERRQAAPRRPARASRSCWWSRSWCNSTCSATRSR